MASNDDAQRLRKILDGLLGGTVTRVVAGGAAGSIFGIDFATGNRRSKEARDWYLAVECAWRLETPKGPICGWTDDNSDQGPMLKGLRSLVNRSVTEIDVSVPCFDLRLTFDNGAALVVFCDLLRERVCWYVLGPNGSEESVEPAGTLISDGN